MSERKSERDGRPTAAAALGREIVFMIMTGLPFDI